MEGDGGLDDAIYRGAFERIDTPAFIADTDFVIREMNEAGLAFTGYEYDEVVGEFATAVAADEETYAEVVDTLVNGGTWSGDFELQTKGGRTVIGQGSAAPIALDGEIQGFVAVFIDKTKQREYQNTAEVLNRLLRHDLRNDLNALYGYVQQIQLRIEDESAEDYLEKTKEKLSQIMSKSERARELRRHLEDTYEASNRPVRLDHALHDALVETINRFDGAEFYFEDFPETHVVADQLLSTVLESVIENAVVHNDKDTPVVEIEVDERDGDVVVAVSDNGPGIPDGQEDLIFGREEIDQLHHGSGVSLFFTDNVIRSYYGEIWVEDNEPEGATFKIRLDRPGD